MHRNMQKYLRSLRKILGKGATQNRAATPQRGKSSLFLEHLESRLNPDAYLISLNAGATSVTLSLVGASGAQLQVATPQPTDVTITDTTTATTVASPINVAGIDSLVIDGSSAANANAKTIVFQGNAFGMPGETGGFDQTAASSHTNTAFTGSAFGTLPVSITYLGSTNASSNTLEFSYAVAPSSPPGVDNMGAFADTVSTGSGVVGLKAAGQSVGLAVSFTNVTQSIFQGAGGTLTVDASSISNVTNITLADPTPGDGQSSLTGTPAAFLPVNFQGFANLTVTAGAGAKTVNINSDDGSAPAAPGVALTSVSVSGGSGNNAFTLGSGTLAGLHGNIHVDGGTGSNSLNFADASSVGPATYTLTDTGLQASDTTANLSYASFQNITLNGSAGSDTVGVTTTAANSSVVLNGSAVADNFTVTNTGSGSSLTINANNGNNVVNINGTGTGSGVSAIGGTGNDTFTFGNGTLAGLQGNIHVGGGTGNNSLTFADANSAGPVTYTLTDTGLQASDTPANLSYASFQNITLNGSAGIDTVGVTTTAANSSVVINGGAAADNFTVSNTGSGSSLTLNANNGDNVVKINGTGTSSGTTVSGGTGNDTFTFGSGSLIGLQGNIHADGGAGTNSLTFADGSSSAPVNYTLNDTALQASDTSANLSFASIQNITVNGSAGSETVVVSTTPANSNVVINGSAVADNFTVNNTGTGSSLTINANNGDNIVKINGSSGAGVSVIGGSGNDTFTVGNGSLVGLQGTIHVDGGTGTNSLTFADASSSSAVTYTLTDTGLQASDSTATISYASFQNITLNGSAGSDTVGVTTTPANSNVVINGSAVADSFTVTSTGSGSSLTISANNGDNVVVINGTGAGSAVSVTAGTGNDSFTLGNGSLAGLQGTIHVDGGTGNNSLTFADASSAGAVNYTLTDTGLQASDATATISYALFQNITLNGSAGSDTVIVSTTPASSSVVINGSGVADSFTVNNTGSSSSLTINANGGDDVVKINGTGSGSGVTVNGAAGNDTFTFGNGSLVGLQGTIHADGGPGNNSLTFADGSSAAPVNYTLNDTALQASDTGANISYASFQNITLNGSAGGDTVVVSTTPVNSIVVINGSAVADNFTVTNTGTNSSLTINANDGDDIVKLNGTGASSGVSVNGGVGNDTFTLGNGSLAGLLGTVHVDGGTGANSLTFADASSAGPVTYTLTDTGLQASDSGANISYASFQNITLNGSAGSDTVGVTTTPANSNVVINGSAVADSFTVTNTGSGSSLTINANNGDNVVAINGTGAGSAVSVTAGAGNDTFTLGNGSLAGLQGTIHVDGGAGTNSLTFADATNAGPVNYTLTGTGLQASDASAVISYASFQNITLNGSAGSDTVVVSTTPASSNVVINGSGVADSFTVNNTGSSSSLTINANGGDDVVNINGTGAGSGVTVNGGAGNDSFTFGNGSLVGLQGTIHADGGLGTNSLTFADGSSVAPVNYTLNDTSLQASDTSANLSYASFQNITLNGSAGGDIVVVSTTPASSNVVINGSAIADSFTVNNTGSGSNLSINAGNGDNVVKLFGTGAGSGTSVTGGTGNDAFTLGNGSLTNLQGTIHVDGGTGNNSLTFSDANSAGPVTYSLNDTALQASDTSANLSFASFQNITLTGSTGGEIVTVATTPANSNVVINGSAVADTFTVDNTGSGSSLNIIANNGDNVVKIFGTGVASGTTVTGGTGNDSFTFGNASLTSLQGNIHVDGGSGTNSLTFSDANSAGPVTYTLNDTALQASDTTANLSFAAFQNITLTGSAGGDNVTVSTTPASSNVSINGSALADNFTITNTGSSSNLSVNAGNGDNVVKVFGTGFGSGTSVTAGTGNDSFTLGNGSLTSLQGTIHVDGGTGNNSLTFSDASTAVAVTYTLTDTGLQASDTGANISYGGFQNITLNGSAGGDNVSVTTTPAGSSVVINGSSLADTFSVVTTGSNSNITINANDGDDSITIINTGSSGNVTVNGGAGNDTISLQSDGTGAIASLAGGAGNDQFNLGNGSLGGIKGPVTIDGGGALTTPVSTLNIPTTAGPMSHSLPVGDLLVFDDSTNSGSGNYTLSDTTFVSTGGVPTVTYANIQSLALRGAQGSDTIAVSTTPANTNVTLNGGNGSDVITVAGTGANNNLTINGNGGIASNDQITLATTGAGTFAVVTGGGGSSTIALASEGIAGNGGVVQLLGAGSNDIFELGNGSLTGINGLVTIDGLGDAANPQSTLSFSTTAGVVSNSLPVGNSLILNDSTNAGSGNYTLASTTIQIAGTTAQIGYANIQSLDLEGAQGGDNINVSSTPASANVSLNGGNGSDTIAIATTGATNNLTIVGGGGATSNDSIAIATTGGGTFLEVTGGGGTNTIDLATLGVAGNGGAAELTGGGSNDLITLGNGSLTGINGLVAIDGMGDSATPTSTLTIQTPQGAKTNTLPVGNLLILDDGTNAGAGAYTLTSSTFQFSGSSPQVLFANIQSLDLEGANGGDATKVSSTPASANVSLAGGTGNDTFTVDSTGANNNLTIDGNGSASSDVITINGTGDSPFIIATLGDGAGAINLFGEGSVGKGGAAQLTGGAGSDVITVGNGLLSGINGLVNIDGGGNSTATVPAATFTNAAGSASNNQNQIGDTLIFNDSSSTAVSSYTMTASTFQFSGAQPQVGYTSTESIAISGAAGGDTINVTTTGANENVTINGGTGNDAINVTTTGANNNLAINGLAGADTITIANTGAKPFVIANGGNGLNVFNLQANGAGGGIQLVGGGNNDIFNLGNSGVLAGINGLIDIIGGTNDGTIVPSQQIKNDAGLVFNNAQSIGDTINLNDNASGNLGAYVLDTGTFQSGGNSATGGTFRFGSSAAQIGFEAAESLNLSASATNADTITVNNTLANSNVTLTGGSGSDAVTVNNLGNNNNLTINTGSGAQDSVSIVNTGSSPFVLVSGNTFGQSSFFLNAAGAPGVGLGGAVQFTGLGTNNQFILGQSKGGSQNSLAGILALVNLVGSSAGDTLSILDQNDTGSAGYTLDKTTFLFNTGGVSNITTPQVGYSNIPTISIFGGNKNDAATVTSTQDNTTLSYTGGSGNDSVNVASIGNANKVTIKEFSTTTTSDSVSIKSTGTNPTVVVTTGVGNDALAYVPGMQGGTVTLNSGDGNDVTTLGNGVLVATNTSIIVTGSLTFSAARQPTAVTAGGVLNPNPTGHTVILADSANGGQGSYTLAGDKIAVGANVSAAQITINNIQSIQLNAAQGGDSIVLSSSSPNSNVAISGGASSDAVYVVGTGTNSFVSVNGGTGADRIWLTGSGQGSAAILAADLVVLGHAPNVGDSNGLTAGIFGAISVFGLQGGASNMPPTLVIDDGGDTSGAAAGSPFSHMVTVNNSQVLGLNPGPGFGYTIMATVNVYVGGKNNLVQFASTFGGTTNIIANSPASAGQSDTFDIVGAASSLQGLVNVQGGNGSNEIRFANGAGFSNGHIFGGTGFNFLNYAAYQSGISVSLVAHAATGLGSVFGVENVVGGVGNDNIVGDNSSNVLFGGPGSDLVNGLGGADTYYGGSNATPSQPVDGPNSTTPPAPGPVDKLTGTGVDLAIVFGEDLQTFNVQLTLGTFSNIISLASYKAQQPAGSLTLAMLNASVRTNSQPPSSNKVSVLIPIGTSGESRTYQINQIYQLMLGRAADPGAVSFFLQQLNAGASLAQVASSVANSNEYATKTGGTNEGFITGVYNNYLGRNPGTSELTFWNGVIGTSGRQVAALEIITSGESVQHEVVQVSQNLLSNPAAGGPVLFLGNLLTPEFLGAANQIGNTTFKGADPSSGNAAYGNLTFAYVDAVFEALLGRGANSGDLNFFLPILESPFGPVN